MKNEMTIPNAGPTCSIERTLQIVGERWTFLILRESLLARLTKFGDFQSALGIAPNILTDRLNTLVAAGLLEKQMYREIGDRQRASYHPTQAGEQLKIVLAALQQWGDDNIPPATGVTIVRRTNSTKRPLRVGFIDDRNRTHELDDVAFIPSASLAS